MATITVQSDDIYNGEYDLDLSYFTNRELHIIKKETGIRAGELPEALAAADTDLLVAFALIGMRRKGLDVSSDALWDLPSGKIVIDVSGDDAGPPDETSPVTIAGDKASSSDSSASGESSPEASPPSDSGNPG